MVRWLSVLRTTVLSMTDTKTFPVGLDDIWLRRDLIDREWTDRDIARHVRAGLISKVRYGAYVDSTLWSSLSDRDRYRARSRAVLRTAHEASVLTHQSALAEWDVPLWRIDLTEVALTRTDERAGRRESLIVHHSGRLPLEHITMRHGVPIATAARTAVELLSTVDLELGLVLLNGLLNLRRTTLEEVARVARQTEHWPDTLNTRIALGLADARLQSVAESRFVFLCYRQRLPRPEPQVEVVDEGGDLIGIVDFLWREYGVFLEFDGRIKYERFRRAGESLEDYVMREKHREESICQVTGWVCIRITWADLENPVRTARRIRNVLAGRTKPAA